MDSATIAVLVAFALGVASALLGAEIRRRWMASAPGPSLPSPTSNASADDEIRRVAAISAAVYAVLGAHRVVYIGEAGRGPMWASLGRVIMHTSHTPHQPPAQPDRRGHG